MRTDIEMHTSQDFDGLIQNTLIVDKKEKKTTHICKHDVATICTSNEWEKINGVNGFSAQRSQRHIGEIPVAEFFELKRQADEAGTELTGADVKKYLRDNPEYMTVNAIDTGRDPRIIIK